MFPQGRSVLARVQQLSYSRYVKLYPVTTVACLCLGVPPPSALQHVQLVNNPRNGSEAGDIVTMTPDNNTATGLASSSQVGNLGRELPIGYAGGICVGEGLPPVPERLAARSDGGEFIEMCELILEYWLAKEEDGTVKAASQEGFGCLYLGAIIHNLCECQSST